MSEPAVKYARNSFSDPYPCKKHWPEDCFVQCGGLGVVLAEGSLGGVLLSDKPLENLKKAVAAKDTYTTAFFEAFPKKPSCFIRGEGKDIEEAEQKAFDSLEKILSCPQHEFEARGRKDGYGYCKHCELSMSGVLPILNKCCKCKAPTNWTSDAKGLYYCHKHSRNKPKPTEKYLQLKRLPRRRKKRAKALFYEKLIREKRYCASKIIMKGKYSLRLVADDNWSINIPFLKRS